MCKYTIIALHLMGEHDIMASQLAGVNFDRAHFKGKEKS